MSGITSDPTDPRLKRGVDTEPTKQSDAYLVLSDEDRAKGFVRPVRKSYRHVGEKPVGVLRDLTSEEKHRIYGEKWHKAEVDIDGHVDRLWTSEQLAPKCGTVTSMGTAIAETYATNPKFYGSTYCCACQMHLPVAEFVWEPDGSVVGS